MSRMVTAPGNSRQYETIYILKPDIDADSAEKISTRIGDVMDREKGRLTKVELWGRRKLAYDIKKQTRGVYMYLSYLGDGKVVDELERNLRLFDDVLKFQTVVLDVNAEAATSETEAVKFERIELPPMEEEREDWRERQLGLVEEKSPPSSSSHDYDGDSRGDRDRGGDEAPASQRSSGSNDDSEESKSDS